MLELSKQTHLLERDPYRYRLQEVQEPELSENLSLHGCPAVVFNHRRVDLAMPEEIWITDTSFRDGQRSQSPTRWSTWWSSTSLCTDLAAKRA